MIPKKIHYCWLSDDPVPEELKDYMKSWKEKFPDYEFILWNFERFDKASSLWVRQAFENKKYAFAADFIRLYAVYNYGGIYMDMDIEVLKNFDKLLDSPIMIAFENPDKMGIEAGCFGAEKGNSFIGDCLSYYENRSFINPDGSFDTLPLPKIMKDHLSAHPEIKPLDWHYFTNKSCKTGKIETTEKSYAVHHFAGSWLDDFSREFAAYVQKTLNKFGKCKKSSFLIIWFHIRKSFAYYGFRGAIKHWNTYIRNLKK